VDIGGFFSTIASGGPAMWMLLILSIVAVAIVIERLMFFTAETHADAAGLVQKLGQKISANDLNGAIAICNQEKGMLPKVLASILQRGREDRESIDAALQIALMKNLGALERNLGVIGTISVIAPFVGLFGTVLGIIKAFQDIALKGNSTPAVSGALITTAAGLFVAVVSVIFFNYFKTTIKSFKIQLESTAQDVAESLNLHNAGVAR
jgi:biopolymer transport protein ExbB